MNGYATVYSLASSSRRLDCDSLIKVMWFFEVCLGMLTHPRNRQFRQSWQPQFGWAKICDTPAAAYSCVGMARFVPSLTAVDESHSKANFLLLVGGRL